MEGEHKQFSGRTVEYVRTQQHDLLRSVRGAGAHFEGPRLGRSPANALTNRVAPCRRRPHGPEPRLRACVPACMQSSVSPPRDPCTVACMHASLDAWPAVAGLHLSPCLQSSASSFFLSLSNLDCS